MSDQQEIHELSDLVIDTVGLVDKAANKRTYLLYKRDSTMEEDMGDNQEPITDIEQVVEQLDKAEDAGAVASASKGLIGWLKAQFAKAEEPPAPVPAPEPEPDPDPAIVELREVTKSLTSELQKAQARAAEAERIAKEERDRRITQEYVAKAEALAIPGKADDLAETLRKADEAGVGEAVYNALKAASEAVVQSGILTEKGTTKVDDSTKSDFIKAVEDRAAELRKADPELSEEVAFSKAYTQIGSEQTELAKDYIAERQHAVRG